MPTTYPKDENVLTQSNETDFTEPTAGQVYKDFQDPNLDTSLNDAYTKGANIYGKTAFEPVNEDNIRQSTYDRFQKEIDATNQIYAQKLNEVQNQGKSALGTNRATQARGGLLGSDFGSAQKSGIVGLNNQIESSVQAERAQKIAEIADKARAGSAQEIADKRAAQQNSLDAYINFLSSKGERRTANTRSLAQSLFDQGLTIEDVDPTELSAIAKNYGVSTQEVASAFKTIQDAQAQAELKAQQDAQKALLDGQFNLSEGQARYDVNGNLIASRAKTYAPSSGGGSSAGGIGGSTQYGSDLDAVVGTVLSTIPTKFGQETFQRQLANTRNDADKINLVAAQVLRGAPTAVREDFTNQSVAISNLDKAISKLDSGVKTGVINDKLQYAYNIVGRDFDPKLQEIQAYITSAIQPYRNSVTGAAWGTQEESEYQQLFGSTKYSPAELKNRLINLKEILKSKSAQGLNAVANPLGYYDNQFATGNYAPSDTQSNGGRVPVIAPDGTEGTIDQSEIDEYTSQGYTVIQ